MDFLQSLCLSIGQVYFQSYNCLVISVNLKYNILKANSEDQDQTPHLRRLTWVCTVCICPKESMLYLYVLMKP